MPDVPFHEPFVAQFGLIHMLTVVRFGTLASCCPTWLAALLPFKFRAVLVIGLSFLLTPLNMSRTTKPVSLTELPSLVGQELIVGIALGFAISSVTLVMQMVGSLLGRIAGANFDTDSPNGQDESASAIGVWFRLLGVALLVSTGGHRMIVAACCDSLTAFPPGTMWKLENPAGLLVEILSDCFSFAVRVAAPVALSVIAASVIGAVAARFVQNFASLVSALNLGFVVLVIGLFLSPPMYETLLSDHVRTAIELINNLCN